MRNHQTPKSRVKYVKEQLQINNPKKSDTGYFIRGRQLGFEVEPLNLW